MFLIRVPDDTVNRLKEIANSQQGSCSDYLAEILEQAVRAHELGCSVKDAVDLYERTVKGKTTQEAEQVEEPSVPELFERMHESKLRPDMGESEERKMLSKFLSEL
ncbi:MAG: hypothetical protein OEZ48_13555 [Candidatus Bathyarchaeota archaeon]|nr:hypothetical protein [Candidatus Bathyarchaeota archaeon]